MKIKFLTPQAIYAGIVILVLLALLGYWAIQYAQSQVKESFSLAMKPLQEGCHHSDGCLMPPKDWVEQGCPNMSEFSDMLMCATPPETSAFKGLLYGANENSFVVRWRYVEDTVLIAHGGKGKGLLIEEIRVK